MGIGISQGVSEGTRLGLGIKCQYFLTTNLDAFASSVINNCQVSKLALCLVILSLVYLRFSQKSPELKPETLLILDCILVKVLALRSLYIFLKGKKRFSIYIL